MCVWWGGAGEGRPRCCEVVGAVERRMSPQSTHSVARLPMPCPKVAGSATSRLPSRCLRKHPPTPTRAPRSWPMRAHTDQVRGPPGGGRVQVSLLRGGGGVERRIFAAHSQSVQAPHALPESRGQRHQPVVMKVPAHTPAHTHTRAPGHGPCARTRMKSEDPGGAGLATARGWCRGATHVAAAHSHVGQAPHTLPEVRGQRHQLVVFKVPAHSPAHTRTHPGSGPCARTRITSPRTPGGAPGQVSLLRGVGVVERRIVSQRTHRSVRLPMPCPKVAGSSTSWFF